MYYMVTATHAKDGVTFEYVANVPDVESVYSMAEDSGERVLSIREMTVSELIEREKQELMDTVARTYVFAKYKDKDFETRLQKLKEFNMQGGEFFLALKSFNERQMYLRRLLHRKKKGNIDLDKFLEIMNGLVDCTDEDDIDNLISKMDEEIE
ncbi:MAG: hypothetical protein IJB97_00375 [Clostridia bacterium]|nr:hypothetical protein [Clostridia bacterium]